LWSIGVVAATALLMALTRPILFLALVAVLSFYLAFSGYRVLKLKPLAQGGAARLVDWAAALLTLAACAGLIGFALIRPAWVQHMGVVAVVLGAIGLRATGADIVRFVRKPADPRFWLYAHLGKFIGSYIAIWTAFSTVTLSRVLPHAFSVVWLWPSAIGLPAIALTVAWYKRKHASPAAARTVRTVPG
jgi:predicted permease